MFKKNDFFVILIIAALCAVMAFFMMNNASGGKIRVTLNGKEYATYNLYKDAEYIIKTESGENTLVIKNSAAYFKNSDCYDKTCENMGKICNVGESIVCLPHRLIAEVVE